MSTKFSNSLILSLIVTTLSAGCNNVDKSSVQVAGGKIDGADGVSKYPGTVYVELAASDFSGKPSLIRNVGTIVDIGISDSYVLILSLADVFQASGGVSKMPVMKTVDMKLYMSSGSDVVSLPALQMNDNGYLQDQNKKIYFMFTVGVKAEKTGDVDRNIEDKVNEFAQRLFLESPLKLASGQNLRDSNTSFVMISIPKDASPVLSKFQPSTVLFAEERPEFSSANAVVVGFGENTVGSEQKNQFSLSNALPSVMKRNFAPIDSLNVAPASYTPLRQLIGSNSAIAKQIFEFSGSGLCGSKDGSNYDTGAAVYVDGKFAGFSVRSTTISAGYKGQLRDCSKVYGKDIATLAVGLTRDQIEKFKAGVAARK